jgi:chromosome segregation ATPase
MITEIPQNLAIGLLVVALLAAVMGYVIATIRATKRANFDVQSMQTVMTCARVDAEAELGLVSNERTEFKASLSVANERATSALKKKESLELHNQFLSQRIQALESQVSSYEEQQNRLQRDFATYKSNKARELELARIKPESWSQTGHLPVLNKRISHDESFMSRTFPTSQLRDSERLDTHNSTNRARAPSRAPSRARSHTKLSLPLSRELDIPALAESELPDSLEELEFELVDFDTDGGHPRG